MISRSILTRGASLALRCQSCRETAQRGFAAAAENASYEPSNAAGVKIASRGDSGPTTRLAIVVKAGTRYQPLPGLTAGLQEFAFKNTERRSALRIVRESELLGGQLTAYHTREALVLQASFLREHLPYFTELLAEVLTKTKYTTHEFHEDVERILPLKQARLDAAALALDAAHAVAFHSGLGEPLNLTSTTPVSPYLTEHTVAAYADAAYIQPNIALVADGATQEALSKWADQFLQDVRTSSESTLSMTTSKYYGGEQRASRSGPNAMVIAFPGYSLGSINPEVAVLIALLGGESNIKWAPGFTLLSKARAAAPGAQASATNYAYSDAGLLTIEMKGPADAVRKLAEESVKALKSIAESPVSKEDLTKAIAKAKFDLLSTSEASDVGLVSTGTNLIHGTEPLQMTSALQSLESVTAEKLKNAAKKLLDGKATVATLGDLHVLPFAEDLGLKV